MKEGWDITFDYIESCNCLISCPCPFTGAPTSGHCNLIMAFHIATGRFERIALGGLNVVMVNEVPGNMRAGGYRTAIYIDARGDSEQQAALKKIFTGNAGGVWAGFAALTKEWLGVRAVDLQVSIRNMRVNIPGALEITYEPMKGIGGKNAALINTGQRIALGKRLNVGKSTVSQFTDYGLKWDNAGCNVFTGRFSHREPN